MKLKINYTIQDLFKHNQLITAEKSNPSYTDLIKFIDKLARLKPYDYVLFIELENDDIPLNHLTVYYDTMDDIKTKMLTVERHFYINSTDIKKQKSNDLKVWLGTYMENNGLMDF